MNQAQSAQVGWYLLYTKPRQEEEAVAQLQRQQYEVYLPRMLAEVQRRGRKLVQSLPLFPRYLFIRLETGLEGRSWGPIRSTRGVSHVVRFGVQPISVDERLIDALRQAELGQKLAPAPLYQPGDRLRITQGPYAGLSAIFQMDDGAARASVLIELLQKATPLTLPIAALVRDEV